MPLIAKAALPCELPPLVTGQLTIPMIRPDRPQSTTVFVVYEIVTGPVTVWLGVIV